jgi:hypothetical protein
MVVRCGFAFPKGTLEAQGGKRGGERERTAAARQACGFVGR